MGGESCNSLGCIKMAHEPVNPFLAATERAANKFTEARHEAEKAKVADWGEAFSEMRQVRRRLERATTPEERRVIRLAIQKSPGGEQKMAKLLSGYKGKP